MRADAGEYSDPMKMKFTYKTTVFACFAGYVVQTIIVNFVPPLFVAFQDEFGLPLSQITLLATVNFLVQLTVDFLAIFLWTKSAIGR